MKLLAISKASHISVNRDIYETRARNYNYEVVLIIPSYLTIGNKKIEHEELKDSAIDVVPLTMLGSNRYSRYKGILGVLRLSKYDIVYFEDDPMTLLAIFLGLWCKYKDIKFICRTNQNRSLLLQDEIKRLGFIKGFLSSRIKLLLLNLSKKLFHHLFTISNDSIEVFHALGSTNISKIPLGFNEDRFKINNSQREVLREKLKLNTTVIAYMGRISEGKGVHILLEALDKIRNEEWIFLIDSFELYADTYKKKIDAMIDSFSLKERTIFFDADHSEIAKYMNASDIIVMPSITTNSFKEEYGRIAPEAMGSGCLMVVSDSGTLPELVSDYGWVFPESDINALALLLKSLINNENKRDLGQRASVYARSELGLKKQASIMNKVFQDIV